MEVLVGATHPPQLEIVSSCSVCTTHPPPTDQPTTPIQQSSSTYGSKPVPTKKMATPHRTYHLPRVRNDHRTHQAPPTMPTTHPLRADQVITAVQQGSSMYGSTPLREENFVFLEASVPYRKRADVRYLYDLPPTRGTSEPLDN